MEIFFEKLIQEFSSKKRKTLKRNTFFIKKLKKYKFKDSFKISFDSRMVAAGDLFLAVTNENVFFNIMDAIKSQAKIIISEFSEKEIIFRINNLKKMQKEKNVETVQSEPEISDVIFLQTDSARKTLGKISSLFYVKKPKNILAVTGTNGKTSVVSIVREIFLSMNENAASLGTLGVEAFIIINDKADVNEKAEAETIVHGESADEKCSNEICKAVYADESLNEKYSHEESVSEISYEACLAKKVTRIECLEISSPKLTTFDSISINEILSKLKKNEIENVAVEFTSHGLHQYRPYGINLSVVCITNLTQDHLDYHKNMDNYLKAKKMIFSKDYATNGKTFAVINSKISKIDSFVSECKKNNLPIIFYGGRYSEIRVQNVKKEIYNTKFDLVIFGKVFKNIMFNLIGEFQLENLMAAIGMIIGGIKFENKHQNSLKNEDEYIKKIVLSIPKIKGIRGRMELVSQKNGAYIFLDFAHTPDALQKVLSELKGMVQNKLFIVFGCGGNRDSSKRKIMGEVAARYADKIILTDDNPREESPEVIINQIAEGIRLWEEGQKKHLDFFETIHNRSDAIRRAISLLGNGDILIIAGKGEEGSQIIGKVFHEFSDRREILKACEKKI